MAEIAPISDQDILVLERLLADEKWNGFQHSVIDRVTAVRILARIRAEQRRGDEEFNAGVEAAENAATGAISKMRRRGHDITISVDETIKIALRALKRPIPKEMNDG